MMYNVDWDKMQKIGLAVFFLARKKIYVKILNFLTGNFPLDTECWATKFEQLLSLVRKYIHTKFQTNRFTIIDFITKS